MTIFVWQPADLDIQQGNGFLMAEFRGHVLRALDVRPVRPAVDIRDTSGVQHPYVPLTDADREAMLAEIGAETTDELFADIPEAFRHPVNGSWKSLTYRDLGERVRAVASGLRALGLADEQRCAILASTSRMKAPAMVSPL